MEYYIPVLMAMLWEMVTSELQVQSTNNLVIKISPPLKTLQPYGRTEMYIL